MEKVSREELARAVCELLARTYDDGAGEDKPTEDLIGRYFAEVYSRGTFLDFYQKRERSRDAFDAMASRYQAEAKAKD